VKIGLALRDPKSQADRIGTRLPPNLKKNGSHFWYGATGRSDTSTDKTHILRGRIGPSPTLPPPATSATNLGNQPRQRTNAFLVPHDLPFHSTVYRPLLSTQVFLAKKSGSIKKRSSAAAVPAPASRRWYAWFVRSRHQRRGGGRAALLRCGLRMMARVWASSPRRQSRWCAHLQYPTSTP
jgi:hypothetical protein